MNEKRTAWNLFVEKVLQRIILLIVYVTFLQSQVDTVHFLSPFKFSFISSVEHHRLSYLLSENNEQNE